MEKNLEFYRKRVRVYRVLCPLSLLACIILLWLLNGTDEAHLNSWSIFITPLGIVSSVFGISGLVLYVLWQRAMASEGLILRKLSNDIKEEEFKTIIQLIKSHKSDDAIKKLNEWRKL